LEALCVVLFDAEPGALAKHIEEAERAKDWKGNRGV